MKTNPYPDDFADWSDERRNEYFADAAKAYRESNLKPNGQADAKKTRGEGPFRMTSKGLTFVDPSDREKPEIVISGPFEIVAECRDDGGSNWGRLISWRDSDGRRHEWAMPVSLLAGDGLEVRRALLDGGLYIAAGTKARGLLTNYLTSTHVRARARAVTSTGWFGSTFVFPDASIGNSDDEHIILQTPHFVDHAYNIRGSLDEWQSNVAWYAEGNSRLTLAISIAFASALVGPCGTESGGVHFRGKSSVGKTTALHVAGSVWGGGDRGFIRSWRATANGLEGTASIHSDALLCLDEIAQLNGREAGEVAYMLANGQGKARASRDATLRKPARWRLLFLSTGEMSLADKIAEDARNKRLTAGQQVRVIDLPSDTGQHGLFEDLHNLSDAASFANHLKAASSRFYGTASRAFVGSISGNLDRVATAAREQASQFVSESCGADCDGQVKRVAGRFGLIAAAGELATSLEIVPWPRGAASEAAVECFKAWLDVRGGSEAAEDKDGVAAVRAFLSAHGLSRFLPAWQPEQGFEIKPNNLAGFRRRADGNSDAWDFYISSEAWPEVSAGFSKTALSETLFKRGFLIPAESSGKRSKPVKVPGVGTRRAYHISHTIFEGDDDA